MKHVKSACSGTKISYHVVYPNVFLDTLDSVKHFLYSLSEATGYDRAVYGRWRPSRVMFASKFGEMRPLLFDRASFPEFQQCSRAVQFALTLVAAYQPPRTMEPEMRSRIVRLQCGFIILRRSSISLQNANEQYDDVRKLRDFSIFMKAA